MSEAAARINWEDVRSRLQKSNLALEKALHPDDSQLELIYRERATELAKSRQADLTSVPTTRIFVVLVNNERYAVEFAHLTELTPYTNATPVPGGPHELLGVLNVHGSIRSILDLGRLLNLPEREDEIAGGYVLFIRKGEHQTALRVDRIESTHSIASDQLTNPSDYAPSPSRYVRCLTPDRARLLDTDALLAYDCRERPNG